MRTLFGRRARLRWVHLILGGALLMPYYLLVDTVLSVTVYGGTAGQDVARPFLAFALALPLVALTAAFPVVRSLEGAAARVLCGVAGVETGRAGSWAARARTAAWYTLHVGLGGVVSGMSLSVPPAAAVLLALPLLPGLRRLALPWEPVLTLGHPGLAPLSGLALLALMVAVATGAGALLARLAPVLLGPTAAERLAAAERREMRLAMRNRLARELHDSVGHALSAVTLQAAAAGRVLDRDPQFVRRALAAIEETARRAVAELDDVLGVLREEGGEAAVAGPTLEGLPALLERTAAAGVPLEATVCDGLDRLPPAVSREAYRIVQEGLGNALRHAGQVPVRLRVRMADEELGIEMTNPVGAGRNGRRPTGGRGLLGVRERSAVLGGTAEAGAQGGVWRLAVRLPVRRAVR